ncbi:MAG TPA: FAD:protein FMN transferase [Candidatus Fimivivens faecavium]|nr:FAD:protein FMN transferase [Candidatus Fimivivens faecavium]
MRKCFLLFAALAMLLAGCGKKAERYSVSFFGAFDTMIQLTAYCESEAEFDRLSTLAVDSFTRLSRLYDKFQEYEGAVNLCTVNRLAGETPVTVEDELFELIAYGLEYSKEIPGVNIAMGSVTSIWQEYLHRYQGAEDGEYPPIGVLTAAAEHTSPEDVILDPVRKTVFFRDPELKLDLGAVAKGYATERIGRELYEMGFHCFCISSGGNIRVFDPAPEKGSHGWSVGVADPGKSPLDTDAAPAASLLVRNRSVVTSGDYQRYYIVGGKRVHHIIDPETLFPSGRYRSVTVVCEDSGLADLLSTALYNLSEAEGAKLASRFGAEAFWIYEGGKTAETDGFAQYRKPSPVAGD